MTVYEVRCTGCRAAARLKIDREAWRLRAGWIEFQKALHTERFPACAGKLELKEIGLS